VQAVPNPFKIRSGLACAIESRSRGWRTKNMSTNPDAECLQRQADKYATETPEAACASISHLPTCGSLCRKSLNLGTLLILGRNRRDCGAPRATWL